jgi:hypothetical protein
MGALAWSFLRWQHRVPPHALRTAWWSIKDSRRRERAERGGP